MRTAIQSLLLTALLAYPASAQQVLFADDFNDGNAHGWQEFDGTFAVQNGQYRITTTQFCQEGRAIAGNPAWVDYAIDVDFFIDSGLSNAHAAILFRVQQVVSGCGQGRYLQFNVFPTFSGYCRIDFSGSVCSAGIERPMVTSLRQWHHARVEVRGTDAYAWVDGRYAIHAPGFVPFATGRIGLKCINTNSVVYDNVVVTGLPNGSAWNEIGAGISGSNGMPTLRGVGALIEGSPTSLLLRNDPRGGAGVLFAGLTTQYRPLAGGILIPTEDLVVGSFLLNASGELDMTSPWPGLVPVGTELYFQFWMFDASAVMGFSATNGVRCVAP
ncbi:MAG: hypothetical protein IPN34_17540 [Planctomycetes bacterium]|nr:hypothetical protein [Planctomycetota bacterium]